MQRWTLTQRMRLVGAELSKPCCSLHPLCAEGSCLLSGAVACRCDLWITITEDGYWSHTATAEHRGEQEPCEWVSARNKWFETLSSFVLLLVLRSHTRAVVLGRVHAVPVELQSEVAVSVPKSLRSVAELSWWVRLGRWGGEGKGGVLSAVLGVAGSLPGHQLPRGAQQRGPARPSPEHPSVPRAGAGCRLRSCFKCCSMGEKRGSG